jgi:phosphoesterase RecJ-like protein
VVFLDCGNIDRMPVAFLQREGVHILNVDHHHDNTRFGTVNLVVAEASCTAEIVFGLATELGAEITPRIADALYVGLVTDTGRFMYENTTPAAHRMAADLIDAGVDAHGVYRRLFEDLPFSRLELLTRALQGVARYEDGSITMAMLTRADYEQTGAFETDSEGVVDHLRAVEGTKVAVLVRELLADDRRGRRKVSLRATDGKVDVSLIARNLGGGGHRQAAGFTTELTPDQLVTVLRELVAAQLSAA